MIRHEQARRPVHRRTRRSMSSQVAAPDGDMLLVDVQGIGSRLTLEGGTHA